MCAVSLWVFPRQYHLNTGYIFYTFQSRFDEQHSGFDKSSLDHKYDVHLHLLGTGRNHLFPTNLVLGVRMLFHNGGDTLPQFEQEKVHQFVYLFL